MMDNEADQINTRTSSGCKVATPNTVYAWTRTKAEFDTIALPETAHAWAPSDVVDLIRSDGRKWERRCFSKCLDGGPVTVIFQWFEERPIQDDEACPYLDKIREALVAGPEHASASTTELMMIALATDDFSTWLPDSTASIEVLTARMNLGQLEAIERYRSAIARENDVQP
ncbi:hypothetical protein [Duganella vulcania]|uniref:Uncharacterized protein n=1 Tax=Duganella vulcania TaxID=2692166 RepID=A0A845GFG9_9BURK|nr:hypothetical protein [Duganella vulcania]MYM92240.1 hypothetical protein [Duganella vulcania]